MHEVGKYGNSHGQLDPTLCMREVVQALNRVPACAKRLAFHPDILFCEKEIFFPSRCMATWNMLVKNVDDVKMQK